MLLILDGVAARAQPVLARYPRPATCLYPEAVQRYTEASAANAGAIVSVNILEVHRVNAQLRVDAHIRDTLGLG